MFKNTTLESRIRYATAAKTLPYKPCVQKYDPGNHNEISANKKNTNPMFKQMALESRIHYETAAKMVLYKPYVQKHDTGKHNSSLNRSENATLQTLCSKRSAWNHKIH